MFVLRYSGRGRNEGTSQQSQEKQLTMQKEEKYLFISDKKKGWIHTKILMKREGTGVASS